LAFPLRSTSQNERILAEDKDNVFSIKVTIGEQVLPLRVTTEEERVARQAARWINDKIQQYREEFRVEDRNLLLSMCALQLATELFSEEPQLPEGSEIVQRIERIHALLHPDQATEGQDDTSEAQH
jgi:cell division protein ZapA